MLFRRRGADVPIDAWQALAERLELEDATASAERMRRWLDLEGVTLAPVYALRREDQPTLYLFAYLRELSGPTGSVTQRVWNCLLRAEAPFAPLALRAHPKRNKVIESLEASRTGSTLLDLPPSCGAGVSIFARDAHRAARVLTAPVCAVLSRAVEQRGARSVVVGERHVLATVEPTDADADAEGLDALATLATDLYALYALLLGQTGGRVSE